MSRDRTQEVYDSIPLNERMLTSRTVMRLGPKMISLVSPNVFTTCGLMGSNESDLRPYVSVHLGLDEQYVHQFFLVDGEFTESLKALMDAFSKILDDEKKRQLVKMLFSSDNPETN